ncbi:hypothetical protein EBQ81_04560 [bacterium]|nr:hypothetical protein [bacterium]
MFSILNKNLADHGYYINLDTSLDRKSFCEAQIHNFQINNLTRFTALTDQLRQYSCTKSHRAIFQHALSQGLDKIFVAEDDFELYSKPYYFNNIHIELDNFLTHNYEFIVSNNYDILMFGCNPKKHIIPINTGFGINQASTGAWSYLINKNAMRYILDNYDYNKDYQAIDDILPSLNGKGLKTITTIPNIIGHRNGITSTLQPHIGVTYYSNWIEGNWNKHLYESMPQNITSISEIYDYMQKNYTLEKNLTLFITGHATTDWLYHLRYLLKSLPKELFKCRFIVCYDSFSNDDKFNLSRYFRDIRGDIQPSIEYVNGGLISSLKKGLYNIQTPYFIWLEHDWVFLNNSVDWLKLIDSMNNYSFINSVWFNKNDNNIRGFEICNTENGTTPFEIEKRVSNLNLITTCRWSNNPAVHRTSKMQEWFDKYINNEHVDKINQRSHNIEEKMIDFYRNDIINNGWENIKDNWGTFLYGNIGDAPYMGHTDASGRYQGSNMSQPEKDGLIYMQNNPLTEND